MAFLSMTFEQILNSRGFAYRLPTDGAAKISEEGYAYSLHQKKKKKKKELSETLERRDAAGEVGIVVIFYNIGLDQ